MATYNGECFLKEQIDSIVNQTNTDWTLYIQDDGSTDGTIDIIKDYEDPRIVLVDVGLTRQGAGMNFMSLLNMVDSQYYMFCDQDDVWFPYKIELSIDRMKQLEQKEENYDKPILVHTDRTRVDSQLNILLNSELNRRHLPDAKLSKILEERKSLNILRLGCSFAGCTMLFNKKAKKCAFPFYNVRVQDSVVAMGVVSNNGIISSILQPTMLYRIHDHNTCGSKENSILDKFKHIKTFYRGNMMMFYIWKIYGGGSFLRFLYYRYRLFVTRGF